MSEPQADALDEAAAREALAPLRPDADAFAEAVRRRVRGAGDVSRGPSAAGGAAGWLLRAAASVVPAGLLGLSKPAAAAVTAAPLSAAQKAAAATMLPAAGLLVTAAAFVWSIRGVTAGGDGETAEPEADEAAEEELSRWRARWRWPLRAVFGVLLLACVLGQSWLLFGALTLGIVGIGAAARWAGGTWDRLTAAAALTPALAIAGQMMSTLPQRAAGWWADPSLPAVVLFGGAFAAGLAAARSAWWAWAAWGGAFAAAVTLSLADRLAAPPEVPPPAVAARPAEPLPLDGGPYWQIETLAGVETENSYAPAAAWAAGGLRSGALDADALLRRLSAAAGRPAGEILDGLLTDQSRGLGLREDRLFDDRGYGSIADTEWAVRLLAATGRLTPGHAARVAGRLRQTLRDTLSGGFDTAVDAAALLSVWDALPDAGPPPEELLAAALEASYKPPGVVGEPAAGFARYASLSGHWWGKPDPEATRAGVRVMRRIGVPEFVDLPAVRLAAEPEWAAWAFGHDEDRAARAALAREVESLPEYRPPTAVRKLWDARNLVAAALLAVLSVVAVGARRAGGSEMS